MAQTGERTFRLHKMDDRAAYDLMVELKDFLKITDPIRVNLAPGFNFDAIALGQETFAVGKFRINSFELGGLVSDISPQVRFYATFARYPHQQPENPDKRFDYVNLQFGNELGAWSSHTERFLECLEIVAGKDVAVVPESADEGDTLRSLIISQDAAHRRMIDDLHKSIRDLADRRLELEAAAEAAETARKEAHAKAQQELEEQKAALERQSHMATRRNIGRSIHQIMAASGTASRVRRRSLFFALMVFSAYMGLGVAGGLGTYWTFDALNQSTGVDVGQAILQELINSSPENQVDRSVVSPRVDAAVSATTGSSAMSWFLIVKFLLSSVVTIFGFVSAATWLRRYLDSESRHEDERLAFAADIERASWVIEAIHEVKHEGKGELPKEWVDAVTRNLFAPKQSNADLDEGAQALRALIGLAGSAKIGPQGLEMEFNKKGTKALAEGGEG